MSRLLTHLSSNASAPRVCEPGPTLSQAALREGLLALNERRCRALEISRLRAPTPFAVFPGAFNPLHSAHLRMAEHAAEFLGMSVGFELSIANVDKPPLALAMVWKRVAQFTVDHCVWITHAPTFVEKTEAFGGATFVVGADTIVRVAHRKYYRSLRERETAIELIAERGCRFLVFGRLIPGTDRFHGLEDLELPPALRNICDPIPESHFRIDLSSTELRGQGKAR